MLKIYSLRYQHFIFLLFCITLSFAFLMPDRSTMLQQYLTLITGQTHLLQDSFYVGGAGAFFNTSTLLLFVFLLSFDYKEQRLSGIQLSALGLFIGHSFFGLNLINTLPIILGIRLYAAWTSQTFKRFISVSLFSCAASPLISYFISINLNNVFTLILAILIGVLIGFISPPLAEHFVKFHQGFSLYNFGFTTGIITMFIVTFFQYFNLEIESISYIETKFHYYLMSYYITILSVIAFFYLKNHKHHLQELRKLFHSSGRVPDDFFSKFDTGTVAMNGFVTGSVYLCLLLCLKIEFSGPVLGALLSLIGFCSFGKHLKNTIPTSIGVLIAALLMDIDLNSITVSLPLLFVTSLSPITGYYGIFCGILAGFLHMNLVSVVMPLHQGMNLFNNGFSSGFIAAFLVPIIDTIKENKPNTF